MNAAQTVALLYLCHGFLIVVSSVLGGLYVTSCVIGLLSSTRKVTCDSCSYFVQISAACYIIIFFFNQISSLVSVTICNQIFMQQVISWTKLIKCTQYLILFLINNVLHNQIFQVVRFVFHATLRCSLDWHNISNFVQFCVNIFLQMIKCVTQQYIGHYYCNIHNVSWGLNKYCYVIRFFRESDFFMH